MRKQSVLERAKLVYDAFGKLILAKNNKIYFRICYSDLFLKHRPRRSWFWSRCSLDKKLLFATIPEFDKK